MANEIIMIGNVKVQAKEFKNQRIVTVWDIAEVHNKRVAKINELFKHNKSKFIINKDYFSITPKEFSESFSGIQTKIPNNVKEILLFTESGYLKLTKPFTDDLSWEVQDLLVNTYFKAKEMANYIKEVNGRRLPINYLEALEELLIECKKTEKLESKIREDKPKVELYDTLIELKDVLDMKKSAKILNFYNLGRNRLYEILRWNKVLMKDNEPYQSYFERGWFTIKESIINDRVVVTTYVTNKGLEGIRKLLLKLGYKQRENKG